MPCTVLSLPFILLVLGQAMPFTNCANAASLSPCPPGLAPMKMKGLPSSVGPMQTDAMKWAQSPLAASTAKRYDPAKSDH